MHKISIIKHLFFRKNKITYMLFLFCPHEQPSVVGITGAILSVRKLSPIEIR